MRFRTGFLRTGATVLFIALLAPAVRAAPDSTPTCNLSGDQVRWIQNAISSWQRASDELLRLSPEPLPWILLYDGTCAWHVSPPADTTIGTAVSAELRFRGQRVPIRGVAHAGSVLTPAGDSFPVQPRVYASLTPGGGRPYLVAALPSVFRMIPAAAADSLLDERIQSVVSHEIIHTRQLPDLRREIAKLGKQVALPKPIDDTIIEREFADDDSFRVAYERERDLLYAAALEPEEALARSQTARALDLILTRRAGFFTGDREGYARLEDLFLNLEGVAEWVRFQLHRGSQGPWKSDAEIIAFIRGRSNEWAQDEGLALYLLIDRFVPGWQSQLLGPGIESPVTALDRALNGERSLR